MNSIETSSLPGDVQHILASAFAHHIQHLSKEEVLKLVAETNLGLQNENAELRKRLQAAEQETAQCRDAIAKLEAEKTRLLYQISRSLHTEKDWEDFDPSEYNVPVEEILAEMDKIQE